MMKSIWKGDISFGLVSIPISLISTEANNEIHFHLLNSKTDARVRYQRIDEKTGKEVPWNDIVKGYEYEKGNYLVVNDKEFENESPQLFKTIEIEEFVDPKEIDVLFYTKPYYLIAEGKNKKAYVLLREALKKVHKVGIAKIILRTKEYLSLVMPHNDAILLYLVHFPDEIRSEKELYLPTNDLQSYKISNKELDIAIDLIKNMTHSWHPEKYHNEYRETLQKWLVHQTETMVASNKTSDKRSKLQRTQVADFVSLLKKSMKKKTTKASNEIAIAEK